MLQPLSLHTLESVLCNQRSPWATVKSAHATVKTQYSQNNNNKMKCNLTKLNLQRSESVSCSIMPNSLQLHGLQPARLLCPWNFPGKNTGVSCHSLFQGIFPTQGLNLCLLHCRHVLYHLNHQGSLQGVQ